MPVEIRLGPPQRTRFEPPRLTSIWQTVLNHLTPPSHPSTTSESAIDGHTDLYYSESLSTQVHPLELLNPKAGTSGRHKRNGFRKRGAKSSQANSNSRYGTDDEDMGQPNEPVSHVVVEANFDQFTPLAAKSDSGSTNQTPATKGGQGSIDLVFSKAEGEGGEEDDVDATQADWSEVQSVRRDRRSTWLERTAAYELILERLWPNVKHFMNSSFSEASKERSFQKEVGCASPKLRLMRVGMVHSQTRRTRLRYFLPHLMGSHRRSPTQ